MKDIFINQKLRTLTNEFVTVVRFDGENIFVEYRGKTYRRSRSIIGKKLFILDEENKTHTCANCMEMRRNECFGKKEICEYFRYALTISKKESENWPQYGDATKFRMKSGRNK